MITYPPHLRGSALPIARGAPVIAGDWSVLRISKQIGHGGSDFDRAIARVMSWQMHRDSGVRVCPAADPHRPVHLGDAVSLALGWSWASIRADCEVVAVVDGDREGGFAYGTLPGHPERGEEAFLVQLLDDGAVVGSVAAFSRPARWFTRLFPPAPRAVQRQIARRYVQAMLKT